MSGIRDESPFSQTDGEAWADVLAQHPERAGGCDWRTLTGADWSRLLQKRPEFADRCDKWGAFDANDWAELLAKQPSFAARCPPDITPAFDKRDALVDDLPF